MFKNYKSNNRSRIKNNILRYLYLKDILNIFQIPSIENTFLEGPYLEKNNFRSLSKKLVYLRFQGKLYSYSDILDTLSRIKGNTKWTIF